MFKASLSLFLGISSLWAQVRPVVDTIVQAPNISASLPDREIVPNDLISISVFDEPSLSKVGRVGADGSIVMPVLKNPVRAAGALPRELETQIARALVGEQILVHPLVSVGILEYASSMISVVGDVKMPGQFTITGPITLLEALAKSGWTTADAGPDLLFTKSPKQAPRVISIDQLQSSTDPSINLTLTGGEVINVPDAPKIWVTGNVTKPQAVPVRKPGDATVLKVVASVEGLTQYYAKTAYIYRPDPSENGKRHEIPVALKAIMHRKAQDVPLFPDDILLIPDDNGYKRRALLQQLQAMSGAGASAAIVFGLQHP